MSPIERSSGGGGGTTSPLTTKGDVFTFSTGNARLAVGSDHQVLTANSGATTGNDWEYPPGFEIGYDQITASVTVTSHNEAAGTTLITCAAHTFDGGLVIAEVFSPFVINPNPGVTDVSLYEGGTELVCLGGVSFTGGSFQQAFAAQWRFTPTAASHSYVLGGFTNVGNGTFGAGAGGANNFAPAFIRFIKV
jgi:hypothetical protein